MMTAANGLILAAWCVESISDAKSASIGIKCVKDAGIKLAMRMR